MQYLINIPLMMLILWVSISSVSAEETGTLKSTVWQKYLGQENENYKKKAIAQSTQDASVYLAGQVALPDKISKQSNSLFVWKVSEAGELVLSIAYSGAYPEIGKLRDVYTLSVNNSKIIAAVVNESGNSYLVTFDNASTISVLKKFELNIEIAKIIQFQDGSCLLVGRKGVKELVIKLDSSGAEQWRKVFDRGRNDLIVDAVALSDNCFLLIESSGKAEKFFMAESSLFVTKYDSKGNKVDEKFLSGRYGSIAQGKEGSFAVVYDRNSDSSQDIWVQAYDKQLSPLWSQSITTTKFGLEKFKAAGLANGNYVIAGTVKGKSWVTYLDANGTKKWDYLSASTDFENGIDIVANGDDCYLISTVIRLNADKALNNYVKVTKFRPN